MTSPQYPQKAQPGPPGHHNYGVQRPPGPYGHPVFPAVQKKKSRAPMILGILAAFFVLFVGGCAALLAAAGSGVDEAVREFESSVQATGPATSGDTAAPTEAPQPAPAAAGIGTPVRDGDFEFTVTRVEPGVARIGGELVNQEAQGQYVLIHVTVANIGNEAQIFSGSSQLLFDAQGRQFSADSAAAIFLDDSQSFLNYINPGNRVDGIVVFDLPKDVQPVRIELHDSPFSGGVSVALG